MQTKTLEGDRGQQFFQSNTVAEQNATKPERLVPLPLLVIKENRYFENENICEIHSFSGLITASTANVTHPSKHNPTDEVSNSPVKIVCSFILRNLWKLELPHPMFLRG